MVLFAAGASGGVVDHWQLKERGEARGDTSVHGGGSNKT